MQRATQQAQDDDGAISQPDIILNREAIRDWLWRRRPPQVLTIRKPCAFCDQLAATAEWRPAHPGWMRLCAHHRTLVYDMAARTSERTGVAVEQVLDAIMRALCLIDFD